MTDTISSRPPLRSRLSGGEQVLVFRALNLGDMLCAVPAFRALRAGLPKATITLLGLRWARSFASRFDRYLDGFVEFPGYPGLPEQKCEPEAVSSFFESARKKTYDVAIQMHGSGAISNTVVESLGARMNAGFHPAGETPPDTGWFSPYPDQKSEVDRNLQLVRSLGFRSLGSHLEFPILPQDTRELSEKNSLCSLRPGKYVCIHPGASKREKCWPVENFAALGQLLRRRGFTVVVTGNRYESDLAAGICSMVGDNCIDAATYDLSLGSLALLIKNARLLLCNDTGVSHLAAALSVPSVVVFTVADPDRWAPFERDRHRTLGGKGRAPSVQEVVDEVKSLL